MGLHEKLPWAKLEGLAKRHVSEKEGRERGFKFVSMLRRVTDSISRVQEDQQDRFMDILLQSSPEYGKGSEAQLEALMKRVGMSLSAEAEDDGLYSRRSRWSSYSYGGYGSNW